MLTYVQLLLVQRLLIPVVVNRTATVCSRTATGITLANPAATTYNIVSINMNGLTASAGNPVTGTGLTASEISR